VSGAGRAVVPAPRALAGVAAGALLLAGCAVASGETAAPPRTPGALAPTTPPAAIHPRTTTAPTAKAAAGGKAASGPARATGATGATGTPGADAAPLDARLASACVRPGGTQRLTVDTLPSAFIAFDNLYADQRDGQAYGGADGRARSDGQGHYEATWVVSPSAPLGDVRVDLGASASNRSAVRSLHYRLAAAC
jgi:hypothetical protein